MTLPPSLGLFIDPPPFLLLILELEYPSAPLLPSPSILVKNTVAVATLLFYSSLSSFSFLSSFSAMLLIIGTGTDRVAATTHV
jgi:hypothetical protein